MAMKMKVIAQEATTTAATDTKMYESAASKQATGIIFVTNTGVATKYRISLEPDGAVSMANYIAYDVDIDVGDTHTYEGISLYNGQELWVRSTTGNISFNYVGAEEV